MNPTDALGWTLLHFLWQGTLIGMSLALLLSVLRRAGAKVRYGLSCAALLLMLLCAVGTYVNLSAAAADTSQAVAPALAHTDSSAAIASAPMGNTSANTFQNYLPGLVWAWLGGVLALSLRSLGGWVIAERFARRHTRLAEEAWRQRFAELTRSLSISRPVRLAVSTLAEVPAVIGWMRPVVLVPSSIFTGLSAAQIEALLVHELAHIRRHDYLVNLFQTAVETLLFYHPAVWWVSRTIRVEREHCCDDLAVEICGDTLAYVRALTDLEEMRGTRNVPGMAMAAAGGSLLERVQRLLRRGPHARAGLAAWIAVVGIAASLAIFGVVVNANAQRAETAPNPIPGQAALPAQPIAPNAAAPANRDLLAQAAQPPATQPAATAPAAPGTGKQSWLDEIQAAGYRDLTVDDLIAFKIHDVTGDYIRQMRATGFDLTKDELIAFRIHDVSPGFIAETKQMGFASLTADELIAFKIHDIEPAWVRQIQSQGYPNISVDELIAFRIHDITPEYIRAVRARFKDISLDQLIALKIHDIL